LTACQVHDLVTLAERSALPQAYQRGAVRTPALASIMLPSVTRLSFYMEFVDNLAADVRPRATPEPDPA